MSSVRLFDRVLLSSTTVGSGTYSLGAAATGFQDFGAAGANSGDRVLYVAQDDLANPTNWEIGEGVWTAGSPAQLTRATIIASSNGGLAVSWGAGTKWVFSQANAARIGAAFAIGGPPRGHLAGLQLSNDGTSPNTKVNVSAGACTDDTVAVVIQAAAGSIDFATNGANGLDTSALANSTWYHCFAIAKADGTPAFLASTSLSSPTMPAGYTYKRRLGSVKTDGSAHLLAFKQEGDIFQWSPVTDLSTSGTTASRNLYSISTPPGVKTQALIRYNAVCSSGQLLAVVTSPDEPDVAPFGSNVDLVAPQNTAIAGSKPVLTNTSSQIGMRWSGTCTVGLATYGWIDRRGRDA